MQRYIRYKKFIPIEITEKFKKESNDNNQKLIILLLIINVICFPNTLKILKKVLKENNNIRSEETVPVISNIEEEANKNNLYQIINYINANTNFIEFKNNNGIIEVNSKNDIFIIEKEKKFFIKSITNLKEDKIKLEVGL